VCNFGGAPTKIHFIFLRGWSGEGVMFFSLKREIPHPQITGTFLENLVGIV